MRYVPAAISLLLCLVGCRTPERLLRQTRDLRLAGDMGSALPRLEAMLVLRNQRGKPLSAATTAALNTEVAEATRFLTDEVHRRLRAGLPLAAEAVCQKRAILLAQREFLAANQQLRAAVAGTGVEVCTRLTATPPAAPAPYWSHLLSRYCAHWGQPAQAPIALPDLHARLVVRGPFEGAVNSDLAQLAGLLQASFQESVWYGAGATQTAAAEVVGQETVEFSQRLVALEASWVEQVPHLVVESYQEPYQQSYFATEYYSVQVPYSAFESYSYSCGFGTSYRSCSSTRSVTHYRSESRTRMVTKWRTAYRSATRLVTRYQPTPRVFAYQAVEHSGRYAGELRVALHLGADASPLVLLHTDQRVERGLFHDVTFEPAGIEPARPGLTSREGWVGRQLVQMNEKFAAMLSAQWSTRFCAAAQYSPEEAARCAYLGAGRVPQPATQAIAGSFGADAVLALGLLSRSQR